jgi:hypothetical protein
MMWSGVNSILCMSRDMYDGFKSLPRVRCDRDRLRVHEITTQWMVDNVDIASLHDPVGSLLWPMAKKLASHEGERPPRAHNL